MSYKTENKNIVCPNQLGNQNFDYNIENTNNESENSLRMIYNYQNTQQIYNQNQVSSQTHPQTTPSLFAQNQNANQSGFQSIFSSSTHQGSATQTTNQLFAKTQATQLFTQAPSQNTLSLFSQNNNSKLFSQNNSQTPSLFRESSKNTLFGGSQTVQTRNLFQTQPQPTPLNQATSLFSAQGQNLVVSTKPVESVQIGTIQQKQQPSANNFSSLFKQTSQNPPILSSLFKQTSQSQEPQQQQVTQQSETIIQPAQQAQIPQPPGAIIPTIPPSQIMPLADITNTPIQQHPQQDLITLHQYNNSALCLLNPDLVPHILENLRPPRHNPQDTPRLLTRIMQEQERKVNQVLARPKHLSISKSTPGSSRLQFRPRMQLNLYQKPKINQQRFVPYMEQNENIREWRGDEVYQIQVRAFKEQYITFQLDVTGLTQVSEIRDKLLKNIPDLDPNFILYYKGIVLSDYLNLMYYDIKRHAIVQAIKTPSYIDIDKLPDVKDLPKVQESGFTLKPSIVELSRMDKESLQKVQNFTIKNKYGKIQFLEPTNVFRMDISKIVKIEQNYIEVYPDGIQKPPVGSGLNKAAILTMYKYFPKGTQTEVQERLRRFCMERSATFISWNHIRGELKFRVKYFE